MLHFNTSSGLDSIYKCGYPILKAQFLNKKTVIIMGALIFEVYDFDLEITIFKYEHKLISNINFYDMDA